MGLSVPLTWFRGGLLISYADFDFPLSGTIRNFSDYIYVWTERFPPGAFVPQSLAQMPYHAIIAAGTLVGLPLAVVESLILYFLFVGAGLSMHYLMKILGATRLSCLIASAFYMFNSYATVLIWANPTLQIFLYAFLPLVFALFMKGIRGGPLMKQSLVFGISTLLLSPSFVTLTYAVVVWLFLGLFFVCYSLRRLLLSEKGSVFHACKFTIGAISTWVLLNGWWLVSYLSISLKELTLSNAARAAVGISNLSALQESSSHATILSVLGLQGFWSVYGGFRGDPYYSFSSVYSSLWLNALILVVPGLAFAALLVRRKSSLIVFFSLTAIIGVFLAKGLNPPFESVYLQAFLAYPLLQAFREPYNKFGFLIALSYSVLIAETLEYVVFRTIQRASHLRIRLPRVVVVGLVCFLVIGVLPWPLWTGDVVYPGGHVIPSARVSVPSYYQDANRWLTSQPEDFRIYPWPFPKLAYNAFNWSSGFVGADPSTWLLSKPVLSYSGSAFQLPLTIATELSSLVAINPGFEDGNLTGWEWSGQATFRPQGSSVLVQNQIVHGGNWAAEVSVTNTTIYLATAERYSALAGQPLQLETYLRADGNITTSRLVFFFYDSENRYVSQSNGPDLGGNFDWTYSNLSATIPSGVNYYIPAIIFTSRPDTNGHGFADDVYLNGWPSISSLGSVLSFLNVKYVMIHDDIDSAFVQDHPFWVFAPNNEVKSLLNSDKSMVLEAQFGGLTFYRNLEWKPSEIYGTAGYQATSQNDTGLIQATQLILNDTGNVVFASQETIQGLGLSQVGTLTQNATPTGLNYERLSPTSYVVNVNSQAPFFLVLSESYDPNWSARINGVNIQQHFVANGYANGWYVNQVGTLAITIEFQPQQLADIGAIVSVLTAILGVTLLSRTKIKNSKLFKGLLSRNRHRTPDSTEDDGYSRSD